MRRPPRRTAFLLAALLLATSWSARSRASDCAAPEVAVATLRRHVADATAPGRTIDRSLDERIARRGTGLGGEVSLSPEELAALLDHGRIAIVSAGPNPSLPADRAFSASDLSARNDRLRRLLVEDGYAFLQVVGHYGGEELSFLVTDPRRDEVRALGRLFAQESVLYIEHGRNELHYTFGDRLDRNLCVDGTGWSAITDRDGDYTEVRHDDGSTTRFRVDLDPSRTVPCRIVSEETH